MREIEIAVVGSGIGGTLISALWRDKGLVLFEKEPNLGGCASTFTRYGHRFNAGATTFAGYEKGHVLKKICDLIGFKPDIIESDIAFRVLQKGAIIDRSNDFESFLENINTQFPHPNNRIFWENMRALDAAFWNLEEIYFNKYSIRAYWKSFVCVLRLIKTFKSALFKSAKSYMEEVLHGISDAYKEFIDAQLLITLQTTHHAIPLLSMALGLSYPFHTVFYAKGGMGSLIKEALNGVEVHVDEEVLNIQKHKEYFILQTVKAHYKAKKVILNTSVYESAMLFEDKRIKDYYQRFVFSDQSAFVVYLHVESDEVPLHHYQVILEKPISHTVSNAFFVSFSDKDDTKLGENGYSVTLSTHTKASLWEGFSKEAYQSRKSELESILRVAFAKEFPHVSIERSFSATSKTFKRYIGRSNCGGGPLRFNTLFQTPSCSTPFKNLYNAGDTVFAGQGWPGIALGVNVLHDALTQD